MLIISLEKGEKIELGPFSESDGYLLKRYLYILEEMKKQDPDDEYDYNKELKILNYQVYYHDETGKVMPVEVDLAEIKGYYYVAKEFIYRLSLFKGDVIVTDHVLTNEKQKELNVVHFEKPFKFC